RGRDGSKRSPQDRIPAGSRPPGRPVGPDGKAADELLHTTPLAVTRSSCVLWLPPTFRPYQRFTELARFICREGTSDRRRKSSRRPPGSRESARDGDPLALLPSICR